MKRHHSAHKATCNATDRDAVQRKRVEVDTDKESRPKEKQINTCIEDCDVSAVTKEVSLVNHTSEVNKGQMTGITAAQNNLVVACVGQRTNTQPGQQAFFNSHSNLIPCYPLYLPCQQAPHLNPYQLASSFSVTNFPGMAQFPGGHGWPQVSYTAPTSVAVPHASSRPNTEQPQQYTNPGSSHIHQQNNNIVLFSCGKATSSRSEAHRPLRELASGNDQQQERNSSPLFEQENFTCDSESEGWSSCSDSDCSLSSESVQSNMVKLLKKYLKGRKKKEVHKKQQKPQVDVNDHSAWWYGEDEHIPPIPELDSRVGQKIRRRIERGNYVDIFKIQKPERVEKIIRNAAEDMAYLNWLGKMMIFMACYMKTRPGEGLNVMSYLHLIHTLFLKYGGKVWKDYDEAFRRKQHRSKYISFGVIDPEIWSEVVLQSGEEQLDGKRVKKGKSKKQRKKARKQQEAAKLRNPSLRNTHYNTNEPPQSTPLYFDFSENCGARGRSDLLTMATTPVKLDAMRKWLGLYPKKSDAEFLLKGFTEGFRLPISGRVPLTNPDNLKSASKFPAVIKALVDKEVGLGRMIGPFTEPPIRGLIISPVGVVPKKAPGKYRLIQNLSYPKGCSVNDAIDKTLCKAVYQSFETALATVRKCGKGALMAKLDIESAFRLLPLHPKCFRYMGFKLDECYFIDRCLPMGCAASSAYFEKFSTFLQWCIEAGTKSSSVVHYVDDFLMVGPAGSSECKELFFSVQALFYTFGVPLAKDKTVGPTTKLCFLGIEIDTEKQLCSLPTDKVQKLRDQLLMFQTASEVAWKQLKSLLGLLYFSCGVISMGKMFCSRLENALAETNDEHMSVVLSMEIKEDIKIWLNLLEHSNAKSLCSPPPASNHDLQLFADASISKGFGAYLNGEWCAGPWPQEWVDEGFTKNLLILELFPIIVALELWSSRLENREIIFWCDNLEVVLAINTQSAPSPEADKLIKHLVGQCLRHNICFQSKYEPGMENRIANPLSQLKWADFRAAAPKAEPVGLTCPSHLWQLIK